MPARSVRPNRGKGGQISQLQKTLKVMGGPERKKGTKRGRTDNSLMDAPEDLPQNDMAPAPKPKRRRAAVCLLYVPQLILMIVSRQQTVLL